MDIATNSTATISLTISSERQVRRCDMASLMLQTGARGIVCRESFRRSWPAEGVTPRESADASLDISRLWAVGQEWLAQVDCRPILHPESENRAGLAGVQRIEGPQTNPMG